jgi:tetratricopeptide (TPR) repeat protein
MAARDPKPPATIRLQKALECFDRALSLGESECTIVIRAWAGKAFVNAQLGRFEEGVRCSHEALELDRSDSSLWLLQSSLLGIAARKGEALALIDEAYRISP